MPLLVLSPAKSFNETRGDAPFPLTMPAPALAADRETLIALMAALDKPQLKALMGLSDSLAALNVARYARFESQPQMNAAIAFDGPAHRAFSFATLTPHAQAYSQECVATISGLYGLLRPRDAIRPYRLEMGTKLPSVRGKTLYEYWGDAIGAELVRRLAVLPEMERFVVNVASQEYWTAVGKHLGESRVFTIEFPGASVHAKQARGLYCRFMSESGIRSADELGAFEAWTAQAGLGYAYKLAARTSDGPNGGRLRFERIAATKAVAAPKALARAKGATEATVATVDRPRTGAGATGGRRKRGLETDGGELSALGQPCTRRSSRVQEAGL
jgi:hypothetical protein